MKITYLKLKNFIGILEGLGKTELEIDFSNSKNKVIMLFGGIGSGKTTILSSLQPFADSGNDVRKKIIIDSEEGYKEIRYLVKSDNYIIKHFYLKSGTIKSYISKNDIELNPDGGVRTFKERIMEEFLIDSDFTKTNRIGSNVTNFINLSTVERKKYIGNFLTKVDELLVYFKIIKNKKSNNKALLKDVADKLKYLPNIDETKKLIENTTDSINELTIKISLINEKISNLKAELNLLDSTGNLSEKDNDLKKLRKEMFDLEGLINVNTIKYNEYLDEMGVESLDMETIEEYLNNSVYKLAKLEGQIANNKTNLIEYEKNKINLQDRLSNLNTRYLALIENKNEYDKLTKLILENTKTKEEFIKDINHTVDETKLKVITPKNIETLKLAVKNLKDNILSLKLELDLDSIASIQLLKNDYNDLDSLNNKNKVIIDNLSKQLSYLKNNLHQKEILNKRPIDCQIDSCEFIKNALSFSNIENDIKDVETNLKIESNKYKDNLEKFNELSEKISYINNFNKSLKFIISKELELLLDIDLSLDGIFNFVKHNSVDKISLFFNSINEIFKTFELKVNISEIDSKIESLENRRHLIFELNSEALDDCKNEIGKLNINMDDIINKTEIAKKALNDDKCILDECNTLTLALKDIKQLLIDLDKFKSEVSTKEKQIELILLQLEKFNKIKEEIIILEDDLKNENKILKPLNNELLELKVKEKQIKEYTIQYEKLSKDYELIELIYDSLNPATGIPLYFIGNYLNNITSKANELLNITNSKFNIRFELDDKNFFIQIIRESGNILEDILLASQGEQSITSLSLSLSMIENAIKKYNIIYLDEIDSSLDSITRPLFIDLLEKQMELMDMEQVFIISHNDCFDTYNVDLILLKNNNINIDDADYMVGKNILYNIHQ